MNRGGSLTQIQKAILSIMAEYKGSTINKRTLISRLRERGYPDTDDEQVRIEMAWLTIKKLVEPVFEEAHQ